MKKEKKGRKSLLDHAVDRLDLPAEVLIDMPKVSVTAGARVVVENHKGLMDYGTEQVLVAGGRQSVKISGANLELRAMTAEALLVTGEIFQIEFIY